MKLEVAETKMFALGVMIRTDRIRNEYICGTSRVRCSVGEIVSVVEGQ